MKTLKKYLFLVLSLLLCLSLAACGGSSDDYSDGDGYSDTGSGAPESFEGMVKDSELMVDYGMYFGTWVGEDNSELIVGLNGSGDTLFELYDAEEDLTASGYVQLVQEYSADYFYNEHDGWAHHCWMDGDGALHIDTFGVFTKAPLGGEMSESDCAALAGVWYLDGEADAVSVIEIGGDGSWTLYERPDGDGDLAEVDWGTLQVNERGDHQYFAISDQLDEVSYAINVVEEGAMYWGLDNDYYERMA